MTWTARNEKRDRELKWIDRKRTYREHRISVESDGIECHRSDHDDGKVEDLSVSAEEKKDLVWDPIKQCKQGAWTHPVGCSTQTSGWRSHTKRNDLGRVEPWYTLTKQGIQSEFVETV